MIEVHQEVIVECAKQVAKPPTASKAVQTIYAKNFVPYFVCYILI